MSVGQSGWFGASKPIEDPAEKLDRELTDEDREIIDWIAEQIISRRLTAPGLFLLESSKPLNFVSSQLLVFLSPLLGIFLPRIPYDRLIALLEKRPFIEVLMRSIESREEALLAERRAKKEEARAARKAEGK